MYSRFPERLLLACGAMLAALTAHADPARELRVCAEPDNPPYSQRDESGFENRIAHLVADDMDAKVTWFWQEHIRGFVRKTMGSGHCDLFIGVPAGFERVLTTKPYYRSTYVAVYHSGTRPFAGFDPDALRGRRIGVQLIGRRPCSQPAGVCAHACRRDRQRARFPAAGRRPGGAAHGRCRGVRPA
jgi:hypothetical protein